MAKEGRCPTHLKTFLAALFMRVDIMDLVDAGGDRDWNEDDFTPVTAEALAVAAGQCWTEAKKRQQEVAHAHVWSGRSSVGHSVDDIGGSAMQLEVLHACIGDPLCFWRFVCDMAIMYPMIEMCGHSVHARRIEDVVYVYNLANQINEHKSHRSEQIDVFNILLKKKPYMAISSNSLLDVDPVNM
jgi:hypothetical protein